MIVTNNPIQVTSAFANIALRNYDKLALSNPLIAKSIVSCTTYATAELFRQGVTNKNECESNSVTLADGSVTYSSDGFRRGLMGVAFMAFVGALIHAPWINMWFGFLEWLRPGKTSVDIASKVALDQLIGTPAYFIIIMTVTGFADGHSTKANTKRIRQGIWPAMKLSWSTWPLLHIVNFALVPLQRRALLLQFGGLLWAIFLCYTTSKQNKEE
mmetsp:Transcript_15790/g.24570  ORF Transcript_15790/g.24570 Transcript_15790/m.24570 type:complete len:214 (+) Transcript_15790:244-885(+)|eukprot:CAMPEP_0195294796 /NCGR_PEP_ID=MMETSP0707-20130614/15905_1 /TAXON_ID=33640 /ORGANISM="Asterionellopsis glacialis, Strain CCMP134" /LENGTH=213 /DNA_ID=CAMNT_0040355855 /DNA_START=158 /DNA_END=799 /DNA_ORIENTATION=+